MHAKVGPTSAPGACVSANPAEKRSMSLGLVYSSDSFFHKVWGISAGDEPHEVAVSSSQNFLNQNNLKSVSYIMQTS